MSDNIDFELLSKHILETRDGVRTVQQEQRSFRAEMKDGMAVLHAHDYTQLTEMKEMRRRLDQLEQTVERLSTAAGINETEQ